MTGRPRSSGRSRCSTAAKNASRSTWRIVRVGHGRYHRPAVEPPADRRCRPAPTRRPPSRIGAVALADRRRRGSSPGSLPLDRDRPRLADPLLRPGLGRRPARRPGPAGPGRGRRRDRHQRLRLGAPRRTSSPGSAGFGREPIIVSAVLAGRLASLVVARIRHRWLAPLTRPTRAAIAGALRADAPAWIVAVAVGVAGPASSCSATAGTRRPNGWVSGGWNWSDLLVHVSIGSSIAAGNFPPEVPYFAGVPLTYHWFADFHGAITSTVAGVDLIPVYFADERAVRGRPGARRLGAGRAPDRQPAGRDDRDDPRLLRRRAGLDPAGRRPHRRRRRRRSDLVSPQLVRQHLGRRLAVLQDRVDLRDRASCRTARRRSGCPGS